MKALDRGESRLHFKHFPPDYKITDAHCKKYPNSTDIHKVERARPQVATPTFISPVHKYSFGGVSRVGFL